MRAASILVACLALAQLTPESQKLLDAEIGRQRAIQVRNARGKIASEEKALARSKAAKVDPSQRVVTVDQRGVMTYPSAKLRQHEITLHTKQLADAKKKLAALEKDGGEVELEIVIDRMEVGHIGKLVFSESVVKGSAEDGFEVIQVIDGDNMIVKMFGKATWIAGRPTSGLVDGRRVQLPETFRVSGTKTYTNAAGSSSTVFKLEPFQLR